MYYAYVHGNIYLFDVESCVDTYNYINIINVLWKTLLAILG